MRLAGDEGAQVFQRRIQNTLHSLAAVEGDVRGNDHVVAVEQRVVEEQGAELMLRVGLSPNLALDIEDFSPSSPSSAAWLISSSRDYLFLG